MSFNFFAVPLFGVPSLQHPSLDLVPTPQSHGLPYPANVALGRELEAIVRSHGAVPATIMLMAGRVHIGVSDKELEMLASPQSKVQWSASIELDCVCLFIGFGSGIFFVCLFFRFGFGFVYVYVCLASVSILISVLVPVFVLVFGFKCIGLGLEFVLVMVCSFDLYFAFGFVLV
jgi:hypothetical protein